MQKPPLHSLTALRSVRSPPILSAFKFYLLFISKCQMLCSPQQCVSSVKHKKKSFERRKKNRAREDWRMIFNDSASLNLLLILIIIFCFILTKQCFTNCVQFQNIKCDDVYISTSCWSHQFIIPLLCCFVDGVEEEKKNSHRTLQSSFNFSWKSLLNMNYRGIWLVHILFYSFLFR